MRAFRAMAVLFTALAVYAVVQFVVALGDREIRSGVATFALIFAATAFGMWRLRRWGRSLALIMATANAGVGTLGLMAVLLSRRGAVVGPLVLIAVSAALAYLLSRPVFNLPDDY